MKVLLNKIASATRNCKLSREVTLSATIIAEEGSVLAVRALDRKAVYNEVEDIHGRMATVNEGDIVAGVLGERRALHGYTGVVPAAVKVGDIIHLLNLGGVIGLCTSFNPDVGPACRVEVLGQVLTFPHLGERRGVPANIKANALPTAERVESSVPLVAVSGTCMNAGKTYAACEVIRGLTRRGFRVGAAKLTGVSLRRDTLKMEDVGAVRALSFNDAGIVSTRPETSLPVARGIVTALNAIVHGQQPDVIVLELGDGVMGEYGVQEILGAKDLMGHTAVHIMCANDPVGAWGAARYFEETLGLKISVVSGPQTDNAVGRIFVEQHLGLPAINARTQGDALAAKVAELVEAARRA
ncbi:hypothetical protein LBMAG42_19450 [Deltaproteobacteria bacterium]|nr:hypothetical protein LBMAG42_19450 [Deltaproteobacteria bacterium]